MRALLDANILISYLLTPAHNSAVAQIMTRGLLGEFVLLFPERLFEEIERKALKNKYLADRIAPEVLASFFDILVSVSEIIPEINEPIPKVTRDWKDDYLLAYALVGQADYLVTGDNDLLVLQQVGNLSIVSPQEFLKTLQSER